MNHKIDSSILPAVLLLLTANFQEMTVLAAPPSNTLSKIVKSLRQQNTPDAVVRGLYQVHTPDKSILSSKTRQPFDRFFDKNLADLMWQDLTTHKGEVGVLDFDPFYNAQDFDIKNLLVGSAKITGAKATVPVSFTNYKRKNSLIYSLVKQNGKWKISDVRYSATDTLLGFFKEGAQNQPPDAAARENNFAGLYKVGETTCTVKPVKMAFEVKWAKSGGSEIFFFQDRANDKYIFASDPPKGKANVFSFDDANYDTGTFYRADGQEMPIKKIK